MYGALLMVLALYKAAVLSKEVTGLGLGGVGLLKILIRDQVIYFLACVHLIHVNIVRGLFSVFSVTSVCVVQIADDFIDDNNVLSEFLFYIVNPSLLSLLGARLLFNIKEAGENGLYQGTCCGQKSTVSGIDFAEAFSVTTIYSHKHVPAEVAWAIKSEEIC